MRHHVDHGLSLTSATVPAVHDAGPHRVTDLTALELVAQPTMNTLVGRLEARGYVERRRGDADRAS